MVKHPVITIIGVIAVILFGVFFYDLIKNTQYFSPASPNNMQGSLSRQPANSTSEINAAVENYYNAYLTCLKKQTDIAKLDSTSEKQCSYNPTNILTPELLAKLSRNKGVDPLLCTQNIPPSVTVDKAVVTNDTAVVKVHPVWGESTTPAITINLAKQKSEWKIVAIICPTE